MNIDSLTDPIRDELQQSDRQPELDHIRSLYPPTTGDRGFDAQVIAGNIERLVTDPPIDTGHPYLDLSVKTGLAFIDATFQGDHPKYGLKHYAHPRADSFPPTIIAAVDALSAWGVYERAKQLFVYWLNNFVRDDGTINYYGPAISEYGQLLHLAVLLHERAGEGEWWDQARGRLQKLAVYALQLSEQAANVNDLIPGVPEADISKGDPNNVSDTDHHENNRFFHNNAWVARGLLRWSTVVEDSELAKRMQHAGEALAARTIDIIEQVWPRDAEDWWLSPQVESCARPESITSTLIASYANYRYWPELLSSGILPDELAHRLVDARLNGGGQFCGMTRFRERLDDWPLADYLFGVWRLGRREDFLLSLFGHAAYHQAGEHLTAYEQVTLPPCREMKAPYCLSCQLVVARAARLLVDKPFVKF